MSVGGMILGIKAHVSNRIVKIAISIDIPCRNTIPPAKEFSNPTLLGFIDQLSLLVAENLHWAPFMSHQKIDPAVCIDI